MMMASIAISSAGSIWEDAADPKALAVAEAFEAAWKHSRPGQRPDPLEFVDPADPARPSLLLALLRGDLAQRRRVGELISLESYRERHPELTGDGLVALVYEEFCLREEAGETIDPADYSARFPEIASRLSEVLEIHELVADPGSTSTAFDSQAIPFPEAGQTIAGFHLVEELGRGSFARVFLARERQLADRLVALKVSRSGSREPQTLARLQHTHIVPIHSYRLDRSTGLHLLCMPFFGRVTLSSLLAELSLRDCRSGADLVEALDRIDSTNTEDPFRSVARSHLIRRSYPRAVAWWGARLAEGLQHAHDRGVLHRDVKPSNVLIAGDGMPMLLDFNLSREQDFETVAASKQGGTLAYMAPEHLDALEGGEDAGIDHRADLYSLGMVLFEALGVKPSVGPSGATSLAESFTWLVARRRSEIPQPSASPIRIPPGFVAVIRRCLAPVPEDRYRSAADLAVDLQAVADDASLRFAGEPMGVQIRRWLRDHRTRLAVALPIFVAVVACVAILFRSQAESLRRESGARELLHDGIRSAERDEFQAAAAQFIRASALIHDRADLTDLQRDLDQRRQAAERARRIRGRADQFFDEAESLRFALLGFEGNRLDASKRLAEALRPFDVGGPGHWTELTELDGLDPGRRARLVREVDDLLFFLVVALAAETRDRPAAARTALDYCDKALGFTDRPRSWRALRDWWLDEGTSYSTLPGDPASEPSADACFRWSLLGRLAVDPGVSIAWLERAARLEPQNYWHQFALAFVRLDQGQPDLALPPCDAAIALRPGSARARKVRARIFEQQGRWGSALEALDEALARSASREDQSRVLLDRGRIRQQLGDFAGAARDDRAVIDAEGDGWMARDARRNLAKLEADRGFPRRALARFDALIGSDPGDLASRRGRARLLLRLGEPGLAEADLAVLIASSAAIDRASALAERAAGRLAEDRPMEAETDALEAARLEPTAEHARLVDRARLAAQRDLALWPDDPNAFDHWPDNGESLEADLRSAADRLESGGRGARSLESRLTRAVVLSAARESAAAIAEVDPLVKLAPRSARIRRVRASILERAGRGTEALEEIEVGLAIAPESAELVELRGKIRIRQGELERGIIDLRMAEVLGSGSAVGLELAEALDRVGQSTESAEVWAKLGREDPLDVQARIGLAKARRRLGDWDSALIALEDAAGLIDDRSPWIGRLAVEYVRCLPGRPGRWPRLIDLARRRVAEAWRGV